MISSWCCSWLARISKVCLILGLIPLHLFAEMDILLARVFKSAILGLFPFLLYFFFFEHVNSANNTLKWGTESRQQGCSLCSWVTHVLQRAITFHVLVETYSKLPLSCCFLFPDVSRNPPQERHMDPALDIIRREFLSQLCWKLFICPKSKVNKR